ncbi:ABC transporter permease [Candidatus Caldatribacterium sp.]|uniref:ABC transporter permease n=1 Tax=Candidatus Caldatribacterium sp. TaxID=2282143 RepID=UPI0029911032|nr:ABC transporter permease [Candidatus Caldatribacterium sp.]MDW8081354.1 ABC transporter permease [Candidatus Calescibacterium sp.]
MLQRVVGKTEVYLVGVLVVLSAVLFLLNPKFLTAENLFDVLRNNSFLGIVALGELVVLISGGIDVSFTAVATVAQYIMGVIITQYMVESVLLAFLIPIPIGIALGAFNAFLVNRTRVHPVIITISSLNVFYGFLMVVSKGKWIYGFPGPFRDFARLKVLTLISEKGVDYGLSIFTVVWFLIAFATWVILRYLPIGRKIYALGGNSEAARRAGFDIFRIQLFVYCYIGFLAGLAGFVHAALNQMIQPNAIVGRELDVLAAAILGGASVFGGAGSPLGVVLGVLFIAFIKNGLILMKASAYWHQVIMGFIIVLAAALSAYQQNLERKRRGRA